MIHLIKTPKGKFELYFVVKGRREWDTTPQTYSRRAGCYKVMISLMKYANTDNLIFQDDVGNKSLMMQLYNNGLIVYLPDMKTRKKYIPKTVTK